MILSPTRTRSGDYVYILMTAVPDGTGRASVENLNIFSLYRGSNHSVQCTGVFSKNFTYAYYEQHNSTQVFLIHTIKIAYL